MNVMTTILVLFAICIIALSNIPVNSPDEFKRRKEEYARLLSNSIGWSYDELIKMIEKDFKTIQDVNKAIRKHTKYLKTEGIWNEAKEPKDRAELWYTP